MSLADDLYASDPNRFEEDVWGPGLLDMDPERHRVEQSLWVLGLEDDYWEGWD